MNGHLFMAVLVPSSTIGWFLSLHNLIRCQFLIDAIVNSNFNCTFSVHQNLSVLSKSEASKTLLPEESETHTESNLSFIRTAASSYELHINNASILKFSNRIRIVEITQHVRQHLWWRKHILNYDSNSLCCISVVCCIPLSLPVFFYR